MNNSKKIFTLFLAITVFITSVISTNLLAFSQASYTPGDVNNDGKINISDIITLRRYIVGGYDVTVNVNASDVNADKDINMTDVILIRQYVAGGYGVTLLPSDDIHIHSLRMVSRREPTSTEDGNIEYWYCTSCGKYYSDAEGNTEISQSDIIIPATGIPESSEKYTVTFYDYNETTVLATRTDVSSGGYAEPPSNPTKDGATFLGWSGNYANVTKDERVRAVYSDEKNVFVVQSTSGSVGDTVSVLVSIDGTVKTCGFDYTLMYDSALELVSYNDDLDLDIVVNDAAYTNGIKLNFSAASDKTRQRDIVELTFRIKNTSKTSLPIDLTINSIKEISGNNPSNTTCVVVNGVIKVEK